MRDNNKNMITDQELHDFALQHLTDAQDYSGKISRSHPIEAIRDDILMNKYTKDRVLKAHTPEQLKNLINLAKGFYTYMEWLHDMATGLSPSPSLNTSGFEDRDKEGKHTSKIPIGYIRLYRGIKRPPSKHLMHYIPSSWTHNINIATDWVDGTSHCCILQLDYPADKLLAINALPIPSQSEDNSDDIISDIINDMINSNKIKIHNQEEYEVILPAMDLMTEGEPHTRMINDTIYTIYPVLPDTIYTMNEAIDNITEVHRKLNL